MPVHGGAVPCWPAGGGLIPSIGQMLNIIMLQPLKAHPVEDVKILLELVRRRWRRRWRVAWSLGRFLCGGLCQLG